MSTSSIQSASATTAKYYDLHVGGIGYLKRIRVVKPKKGGEFLACSVSALHGSADSVEYTNFDLRVSGSLAQRCIKALEQSMGADDKVLIGFKVGDIYPDAFTVTDGTDAGKLLQVIKGRLLQVTFAKINNISFDLPLSEPEAQAA
jgi:Protein of unknown function (DUF3577)